MVQFEFIKPRTLAEASRILLNNAGEAVVIAGGTDVLMDIESMKIQPRLLVSISHLEELNQIYQTDNSIHIGAAVTYTQLERSKLINDYAVPLIEASFASAGPAIRNQATIGGNLCQAVPSADLAPPVLALDGKIKTRSDSEERIVNSDEFFTGPRQTILKRGELLTEIIIPMANNRTAGTYLKSGVRNALEIAIACTSVVLSISEDGTCNTCRIALGAVAPTPIRARRAEGILHDRKILKELFSQAATEAANEAQPISDLRASAEHRRKMVEQLVRRGLEISFERARFNSDS